MHPTKRQSFADKSDSTFYNISDLIESFLLVKASGSQGAAAPTVEEMLREDSPELEEVKEEEVGVELGVEEELERELERRRRTPSGRRTPLCGRHRFRRNIS